MAKSDKFTGFNLHLGCGVNYRPECLNIDLFDQSAADIVAHVGFLPFKSNTVCSIEAYHLLEHFDWIEVKYLLNEWFRVLEDDGRLIIEVPDLKYATKKLTNLNDLPSQTSTLQWIYGISERGMRHKTGFTNQILRNFLNMAGFIDIKVQTPQTHIYEKGLRIVCKKSSGKNRLHNKLLHKLRVKLSPLVYFRQIKNFTLLEKNHIEVIESLLLAKTKYNHTILYIKAFARLAICNPLLAEILLQILRNESLISKKYSNTMRALIDFLIVINFHQKNFTLWLLRKKTPGKMSKEFQTFVGDLESRIQTAIESHSNSKQLFSYVASLEPEKIPFFDIYFIIHKASVLFNQASRYFNLGRYQEAKELFFESSKLNPDNYLTFWNLGRLGILTDDLEAKNFYQLALILSQSKTNKETIRKEFQTVRSSNHHIRIIEPVWKSQV